MYQITATGEIVIYNKRSISAYCIKNKIPKTA